MNILIVEDDYIQAESIKKTINSYYPQYKVLTSGSYESALNTLSAKEFHVFILDIDLGNEHHEGGIELAKNIRLMKRYRGTPIIFLTSVSTDLGTLINDTHCYSFLAKPYSENEFLKAFKQLISTPLVPPDSIELKGKNGVFFRIYPNQIIYSEIYGHTLKIFADSTVYIVEKTALSKLITIADGYLVQCHKSYAVNPSRIIRYDDKVVVVQVKNGPVTIPIGRAYINKLAWRSKVHD